MYARHEKKPLWKLIHDFTPEEFVKATAFRYITVSFRYSSGLKNFD